MFQNFFTDNPFWLKSQLSAKTSRSANHVARSFAFFPASNSRKPCACLWRYNENGLFCTPTSGRDHLRFHRKEKTRSPRKNVTQNIYILLEIGQVSFIYVFNTREKNYNNNLKKPATESTCFSNVQVRWNLNPYCLFPSLTSCKTMLHFNVHKVLSCNYARKHCLLIQIPKMVHRCLSTNSNPLLIQAENSASLIIANNRVAV